MDLAYIRDGKLVHTDEAVILACLFHSKGNKGRNSKLTEEDVNYVRRMMKDKNLN